MTLQYRSAFRCKSILNTQRNAVADTAQHRKSHLLTHASIDDTVVAYKRDDIRNRRSERYEHKFQNPNVSARFLCCFILQRWESYTWRFLSESTFRRIRCKQCYVVGLRGCLPVNNNVVCDSYCLRYNDVNVFGEQLHQWRDVDHNHLIEVIQNKCPSLNR